MNSKVLDESIAESLQTLDLMCFSEQYYFLVALISFGMLLVTMGVTTFINTNYNFFGDPVMPVIVVIGVPRSRRASTWGLSLAPAVRGYLSEIVSEFRRRESEARWLGGSR